MIEHRGRFVFGNGSSAWGGSGEGGGGCGGGVDDANVGHRFGSKPSAVAAAVSCHQAIASVSGEVQISTPETCH